jgi:alpha-N-arabinofuranosidase
MKLRCRLGDSRRPSRCLPLLLTLALAMAFWGSLAHPAAAEDNADQNLYLDYVAGSWDDWSFNADRKWDSTEHVRSYDRAGRLSFTQAWGAMRMHFRGFDTRAFDTTGFSDLQFYIHWGDSAPQDMLIYALRKEDFNKTTKLQLAKYAVEDTEAFESGWFRVQVPLAHLGVANVTDLTDILLSGPKPKLPFWIDDVRLIKPRGASRILLTVDAGTPLRQLDGRHLGINTAAWDYQLGAPGTLDRVRASGAKFFRFPGGSTSNAYHWEQNRIGSSKTGSDTTQFMKMVQAAGGQAIITVNYSTGTPAEAAAWVRFANVQNKYNIRYWEIGNENYGNWEPGSHDPLVYARRFGEFVAAMKAVDPTIKIGMVGTYSRNTQADEPGYGGWSPKVLKALTVRPDFYVVHYYPQTRWSGTPHEDDANLLQYPKDWQTITQIVRGMLNEYLGDAAAGVEILATENNSVSGNPGKQSVSFVNALYLADSLGQVLNTEVAAYMWWDLHNAQEPNNNNSPVLYGHREYGDFGMLAAADHPSMAPNTPYPMYYALQLLGGLAGDGSRLVASATNQELLPVYSALQPDGSLAVLVLNKHSQRPAGATVNIAGLDPRQVQVQQYGAFQDAVGAGITRYDFRVSGPRFVFNFPSYSMTLLTLRP